MYICELYEQHELTISFEFFPPKTPEKEHELLHTTVPALKELGASFFSVTYGAGGGTRHKTMWLTAEIRRRYNIEAMSHLTCVGATQEMLAAYLDEAEGVGIRNILALRGDPPKGETAFKPVENGFAYALDLVRFVKARNCFGIGAACYPEGHSECPSKERDWDNAAAKVEAGAQFLITQLFYDWNDFLEMEDYLRNKRGVQVPIVPGILPFLSTSQIFRFTSFCGSKLSPPLRRRLEELASDDESARQLGVEVCTELCSKALQHDVAGIHFYCLNETKSCQEIMHNLGLAG